MPVVCISRTSTAIHMGPRTLKTVVFMGSARNCVPPWGGETRLGDRVLKHVVAALGERKTTFGAEEVTHDVTGRHGE